MPALEIKQIASLMKKKIENWKIENWKLKNWKKIASSVLMLQKCFIS
jgi:hypothetical protein